MRSLAADQSTLCTSSRMLLLLLAVAVGFGVSACGPSSVMWHSRTGEPILIQESAYTAGGCRRNLEAEAKRTGMVLRSIDVKGRFFGDAFYWPLVKGYVCLGTDRDLPIGVEGTTTLYQG